jgi:hypothetical protein
MRKSCLTSTFELKKPTAQTAHLVFFADTEANAKKNQKSCFLPTLNFVGN